MFKMNFGTFFMVLIAFNATTFVFADNGIWKCSDTICSACAKMFPACLVIDGNLENPTMAFTAYGRTLQSFSIGPNAGPLCIPFLPVPTTFLCFVSKIENGENNAKRLCIGKQIRFGTKVLFEFPLVCFNLINGKLSVINSILEN